MTQVNVNKIIKIYHLNVIIWYLDAQVLHLYVNIFKHFDHFDQIKNVDFSYLGNLPSDNYADVGRLSHWLHSLVFKAQQKNPKPVELLRRLNHNI